MPAPAPPSGPKIKKWLRQLGQQIRMRRRLLKISSVATAEAAGISRMTLIRIESGEASVTLGAYLNVVSVLGLEIELSEPRDRIKVSSIKLPAAIRIADYPQLKKLAWQLRDTTEVSPDEALELYERNWRHVDREKLSAKEQRLIESLLHQFGRRGLLV